MAAGLTVRTEKLGELRAFFEDKASEAVGRLIENDALEIDGALSASGVTAALIDKLATAGPFGAGHPEPVFALPRHQIAHVKPVGNGHLKLGLRGMGPGTLDAIAFRVRDEPLGKMLAENAGRSLHLAGTVSINHWNGRQIPQLRVIDAAIPDR